MIKRELLQLMGSLKSVSDNIVFEGESQYNYITDLNKSIIAQIDLTNLREHNFESFGVKSLSKFLDLNNMMYNDGSVNYDMNDAEGVLTIKSTNMVFDYYVYSSDKLQPFAINPKLIDLLLNAPHMMEFDLEITTVKRILDISRLFELDKVIFSNADNGSLSVKTTQIRKNSSTTHNHKHMLDMKIPGVCLDVQEEFIIDVEKFQKIPTGNYKAVVHYMKQQGLKTLVLHSIEKPELKLFVAAANVK